MSSASLWGGQSLGGGHGGLHMYTVGPPARSRIGNAGHVGLWGPARVLTGPPRRPIFPDEWQNAAGAEAAIQKNRDAHVPGPWVRSPSRPPQITRAPAPMQSQTANTSGDCGTSANQAQNGLLQALSAHQARR